MVAVKAGIVMKKDASRQGKAIVEFQCSTVWLVSRGRSKMAFMRKSYFIVSLVIVILGLGLFGRAAAYLNTDDGPMSDVRFLVVKDFNGKPVRNAAVVLHPVT